MKTWNIKPANIALQQNLQRTFFIHPVIAQLLINRGVDSHPLADQFLNSNLDALHDPFALKDMDKAVERIRKAQAAGEKVLIYGDYDVDGVTSSALLKIVLDRINVSAINYIPHRMEEGYGLNAEIVQFARSSGVTLLIAVDCGINAFSEVQALNAADVDVIIIDHHQPDGDRVPEAYAVVDPKRPDCAYPFKHLAAVGLVAKLAQALLGEFPKEDLDLVTIGSIADVVPLVGENRIFVRQGLPCIGQTSKPGIQALLETARVHGKPVKPYTIGFVIGPRLNAAGRMDSAERALKLLLSTSFVEARSLAQDLEVFNQSRQQLQNTVVQEAIDLIEQSPGGEEHKIIIVHKQGWHKGVLGIVASRILERYYRPTVVISFNEEGVGVGSARSIEGFPMFDALSRCSDMLENFGGHKRAAGLTVRMDNMAVLSDRLKCVAAEVLTASFLMPLLNIDMPLALNQITMDLIQAVEQLEPYGEGNSEPVFCSTGLIVRSRPAVMGKDTIKFWVTDGSTTLSAVGFSLAKKFSSLLKEGQKIDLAYTLSIDDWNKDPIPQLKIKDIRIL